MTAWLLTWLWQGSVLAAAIALALRFGPRYNAATRHAIWCASLAGLAWLGWASSPNQDFVPASIPGTQAIYIPSAPDFLVTILTAIWPAITLVSLLRVLPGLHAVFTVRDRCRPFPAAIAAQLPLWLDASTHGRRTELKICNAVPGATVLGFYRPCIAIPSSLVDALSTDELDQVILHEHAHVQRRDDWLQLVQRLLLAVLWVHPAALFVSRAVSREREMACDEWVVMRTGLPKAYARCLARAAEVRALGNAGSTLLPAFIRGRHDLVRRVDRVLAIRDRSARGVSLASAAAASCAMVLMSAPLQVVRFAEIADITFPIEQVQQVQWVRWAQEVQGVRWVRGVPMFPVDSASIAPVAPRAPRETDAPIAPIATASPAPVAPTAPVAPLAPTAPLAPSLPARAFGGVYSSATPSVPLTAGASNRWGGMAAPAVEIASTAKKTSVRLASDLSRAGRSLARRF